MTHLVGDDVLQRTVGFHLSQVGGVEHGEELDDERPDRDDQAAELLIARCEALLAAGDVTSAAGAVSQLQEATVDSARLAAWATCFDGQLSILIHPERLDEADA